ncbi:hypothetical protein K439DRAFT_530494 [Ramaria rubella]|nr:hypothetical protein K439DRAFT_530494 [Ramaria rubella]
MRGFVLSSVPLRIGTSLTQPYDRSYDRDDPNFSEVEKKAQASLEVHNLSKRKFSSRLKFQATKVKRRFKAFAHLLLARLCVLERKRPGNPILSEGIP